MLPILSFRHKADIVFCPDIMLPLWGRGKKISVIFDAFFWESPEHYQPLWLKYYLTILQWGLKNSRQVVTITHYSKSRLKNHLKKDINIDVAWPSSNLPSVQKDASFPNLIGSPYFLHVGVMEKRKNLSLMIEAFAHFIKKEPQFKLVLVGQRGPRASLDDYDNLVSLIDRLKLSDSVILAGHVEFSTLQSYYKNAIGYVFPSRNEGFGLPVLEAFSYGLPVIITPQGALMEVGGDAVLIAEANPQDLSKKMLLLSQDENLRTTLALAGSKRLKEFTPEKFFITLKDIFKQIPS